MSERWLESHREHALEVERNKRRANRERYREHEHKYWSKAPPEKVESKLERVRQWRKRNRDKCNEYARNRESFKKGGGGKITDADFAALCARYGNVCLCCKRSDVELTCDHVIPLSKGGANTIENAQPLCRTCNSRKNNRTIDYR